MKKTLYTISLIFLCGLLFYGATSCNNSSKKTVKNIEDSGLEDSIIKEIVAHVSSVEGEEGEVSIFVGGTEYLVSVSPGKDKTSVGIPDCAAFFCADIQQYLNKNCALRGWPPGRPVIQYNPVTGEICNCFCQ